MAVLTAKARNDLSKAKFGLPGTGTKPAAYPMPDKNHARVALSRESEELSKGKLSPEQASMIKHKADQVLGKTDSAYHNS